MLMFIFLLKSIKCGAAHFNFKKRPVNINVPSIENRVFIKSVFFFKKNVIIRGFYKINFLKRVLFSKQFLKKFKFINFSTFINYFNVFLLYFLEFFFKRNVLFFFKKHRKFKKKNSFLRFFRKIKLPYGLRFNKLEFVYIIYYSLLLKDATFFLNFFKKFFESNRIKLHKKLFFILKKFFRKFSVFFKRLRVRGFFFDLKGKISLTGNAKKKRLFFRSRRHSLTKKSLRVNYCGGIIRTTTGVLGVNTFIFF